MGRRKMVSDSELLAIAREVFGKDGPGTSTREVARRAGVSEAVIYQRYGNKDNFLLAALAPPGLDLDALFGGARNAPSTRAQILGIAAGILAYFRELIPVLVPLIAAEGIDFEELASRYPELPLHQLRMRLVGHVEWLARSGAIRSVDGDGVVLATVAALFGIAAFERLGTHGGAFDSALVERMVDAIWAEALAGAR